MKQVRKTKRLRSEAAVAASERLKAQLAQVENASEIKTQPHTVKIKVQLFFERSTDKITVHHRLEYFTGPVEHDLIGSTHLPAEQFKDEVTFQKFAARVNTLFAHPITQQLNAILAREAVLTLNDVIHYALHSLEIDSTIDLREQAKIHSEQTRNNVLRQFEIQRAGRAPQWQRGELARAILTEMRALPKKERTYSRVASSLKQKYGAKAPDSGDGLRKMLERMRLNWSDLKNGSL